MWDEFEQDGQEEKEGELFEIKILMTVPQDFFYFVDYIHGAQKPFSLSLRIRKISERKGLLLLIILRRE